VFFGSQTFNVPDYNPESFFQFVEPPFGETSCGTLNGSAGTGYAIPFQGTETYGGVITPPESSFKCEARWRMELQVNRDEWNFDEKKDSGWKIKGKIKFAKKLLDPASTDAVKMGGNTNVYTLYAISCISRVPTFRFFDQSDINSWTAAGEMDFEVEIKKDNATGEPVSVMEIPIGGEILVDGQIVRCGDRPEFSINFIHDFYITEIIPPTEQE
jgi:hypothetical protein